MKFTDPWQVHGRGVKNAYQQRGVQSHTANVVEDGIDVKTSAGVKVFIIKYVNVLAVCTGR